MVAQPHPRAAAFQLDDDVVATADDAWRAVSSWRPVTGGNPFTLWVAVAVPVWRVNGKLVERLIRTGFSALPGQPWLLLARATGSPRSLVLSMTALLPLMGEARVAIVSSDLEPSSSEILVELEEPRRALERLSAHWVFPVIREQRLECHFQPSFDRCGTLIGEETFARARLDDGLVGAPLLLSAARALDLLPMIERFLREEATSRFAVAAPVDTLLFLNFSADDVEDVAAFARTARDMAEECSVDPERIVFEATRAELSDRDSVSRTLAALRAVGFKIGLDGLGTGDAGPELIRALAPDFAKIDGRTVRAAPTILFAASLIRRLVKASSDAECRLIATGVETTEQLSLLSHVGVDGFQGYLLAAPRKL